MGFLLVFLFCLTCRCLYFLKNNLDPIAAFKKGELERTLADTLTGGEEQARVETGWV